MTSPTNPTPTTDTGRAPIVKMGHTAQKNYGSDPTAKVKGGHSVRDLSIRTSKA